MEYRGPLSFFKDAPLSRCRYSCHLGMFTTWRTIIGSIKRHPVRSSPLFAFGKRTPRGSGVHGSLARVENLGLEPAVMSLGKVTEWWVRWRRDDENAVALNRFSWSLDTRRRALPPCIMTPLMTIASALGFFLEMPCVFEGHLLAQVTTGACSDGRNEFISR